MLFEQNEDRRCLTFCGDSCVCNARYVALANLKKEIEKEFNTKIIEIPKSNVRIVPIKKRSKK